MKNYNVIIPIWFGLLALSFSFCTYAQEADLKKMSKESPNSFDITISNIMAHKPDLVTVIDLPIERVYMNLRRGLVKCSSYRDINGAYYPEAGEADIEVTPNDHRGNLIFRLKSVVQGKTSVKGWASRIILSSDHEDQMKGSPVLMKKGESVTFKECVDMNFDVPTELFEKFPAEDDAL